MKRDGATPCVEIFYAEICGLCHKALAFFRERGVPVSAYEVEWDGERFVDGEHARELRRRCGDVDFVPQIFIDGRHIAGWRRLEPMIESGEIDLWLEGGPG